jgi:hypothetical protein
MQPEFFQIVRPRLVRQPPVATFVSSCAPQVSRADALAAIAIGAVAPKTRDVDSRGRFLARRQVQSSPAKRSERAPKKSRIRTVAARIRQQKTMRRISWVSKTIRCGNGDLTSGSSTKRLDLLAPLAVTDDQGAGSPPRSALAIE